MFWSGFILISLVPVNSSELQGTELDQTLCISSWSQAGLEPELQHFLYLLVFYILYFYFRRITAQRREDEFEGGKTEKVCLLQVEAKRLAFWRESQEVTSGWDISGFPFHLLSLIKHLVGQRQDGPGLRHLLQHGGHDGNLRGRWRDGGLWRESSSSLPRLQV